MFYCDWVSTHSFSCHSDITGIFFTKKNANGFLSLWAKIINKYINRQAGPNSKLITLGLQWSIKNRNWLPRQKKMFSFYDVMFTKIEKCK